MTFNSGMDDPDELLMLYDGPTAILEGRDIASVARYMKSPRCKQVFVMVRLDAVVFSLVCILMNVEARCSLVQVSRRRLLRIL